jgi:hypothetical protein
MEEIIKKCKCGVFLTVNEHRDYYMTVEDRIAELNQSGDEQKNPDKEIDDELAQRMIKENCIYELQFYPDTPIGSYNVYGTSLDEVVKKALECFPQ